MTRALVDYGRSASKRIVVSLLLLNSYWEMSEIFFAKYLSNVYLIFCSVLRANIVMLRIIENRF